METETSLLEEKKGIMLTSYPTKRGLRAAALASLCAFGAMFVIDLVLMIFISGVIKFGLAVFIVISGFNSAYEMFFGDDGIDHLDKARLVGSYKKRELTIFIILAIFVWLFLSLVFASIVDSIGTHGGGNVLTHFILSMATCLAMFVASSVRELMRKRNYEKYISECRYTEKEEETKEQLVVSSGDVIEYTSPSGESNTGIVRGVNEYSNTAIVEPESGGIEEISCEAVTRIIQ